MKYNVIAALSYILKSLIYFMKNKLYDIILDSVNKEIRHAIREQFKINNIDLSKKTGNRNIFNKVIADPKAVFDKILNYGNVTEDEIAYMNIVVSEIRVNKSELITIIDYYSTYYQNDSLNWVDVSEIANMNSLFKYTKFNGDISRWDVSNVREMTSMFQ